MAVVIKNVIIQINQRLNYLIFTVEQNRDVNGRNCLGCTPLLYACGSGHIETVSWIFSLNSIFEFYFYKT